MRSVPIRAAEALPSIRRYLGALGRRRATIRLLRNAGLLIGGSALAVLLLLLAFADRASLSRSLVLFIAGGAALLLAGDLVVTLRALRDRGRAARLIGQRLPALGGDLLSTMELANEAGTLRPRFSRALYRALSRHTWSRLERLPHERIVPVAALRPAAVLLVAAALAWSAAATIRPGQLGRATSGLLSVPTVGPQAASAPLIGDLRLTYHYPAYLRRPPRTIESTTGQITAPRGTRVTLETDALGPYSALELVLAATERQAPSASLRGGGPISRVALRASGSRWRGELRISRAARYHVEAAVIGGGRLRDPVQRRIDIEVDAHPQVTLFGPQDGREVGARQRVELAYVAHDDHGLSEVRLAYQVGANKIRKKVLWRPAKESLRRATGKQEWDLAGLDLARGGRVAYWIEAVDDDAASGPKVGRSKILHLQVFSRTERHDRNLALQRQLLEKSLRLLSARLLFAAAATPSTAHGRDRVLRTLRALHRGQGVFSDGVRDLESKLRRDHLVSQSVVGSIARMRKRLRELQQAERRQLGRLRGKQAASRLQIAMLRSLDDRHVRELERDALLLANLLDEQKLERIADASRRLRETKDRLAKLLARYEKSKDPALKRQILEQIRQLQRQVARLLAQISKLSRTLSDEYVNRQAVKNLDLAKRAESLESLFRQGKLSKLRDAIAQLDQKLSAMQRMLSGNLRSFRDKRLSAREKAFGQAMDRLHELEAAQRGLAKQTGRLAQAYRRRASRALAGKLAPLLRKQLEKLKKLELKLAKVRAQKVASYQREQLDRGERRAEWLRRALKQKDLAQSLKMAKRLNATLKLLRDDLSGDSIDRYLYRRPRKAAIKQAKRAQALAEEIQNDLEAQLPSPKSMLSPHELAALRRLQRQQKALGQRLRKLQKTLKGGKLPLPSQLPTGLSQAEQLMRAAQKRLGQSRPQQAESAQHGAAKKLQALRETLRRSRQPRASARGSAQREKVKIPGADAFKAPREFRQDILDAMKEKAPASFEKQVRRYYRELVR